MPGKEATKDEPGQILILDEVAAYLKVGKRTAYRLAAAKKSLPSKWEVLGALPRGLRRLDKAAVGADIG